MNCLELKGKYIIRKKDKTIQQKNSLTFFGALQLARLLKKDICYSKSNKNSFGAIRAYDGQYKKITIKDGSYISFPTYNIDGSPNRISLNGNKITTNYAYDDSYTTCVTIKSGIEDTTEEATYSFDLNLRQPINLAKIGLSAKILGDDVQEYSNDYGYDTNSLQQWTIFIRPQGKHIDISSTNVNMAFLTNISGNYLKVYNSLYPKINNKSYYIYLQNDSFSFYCLYYNNKNCWVIAKIPTPTKITNIRTVQDYLNPQIKKIIEGGNDENIIFKFIDYQTGTGVNVELNLQSDNIYRIQQKDDYENNVDITIGIVKQIDYWINPTYKLHNYMNKIKNTDPIRNTTRYEDYRYMQMISDNNSTIKMYDEATNQETKKLQYGTFSSLNDQYLSYNCYSFQNFNDFYKLYNYTYQNCSNCNGTGIGAEEQTCEVCNGLGSFISINNSILINQPDLSRQNIVGFIPFVKTIRFVRISKGSQSATSSNSLKKPTVFYGIDLYEKCATPYNPIKIAISAQKDKFEQENSWYVDSVQIVGNKVVFAKNLTYNQGNSETEYSYIGLFGNFKGHIDGTLPCDIQLKPSNCYSMAKFSIPWTKDEDQQIMLNYQLTLDNEETTQFIEE